MMRILTVSTFGKKLSCRGIKLRKNLDIIKFTLPTNLYHNIRPSTVACFSTKIKITSNYKPVKSTSGSIEDAMKQLKALDNEIGKHNYLYYNRAIPEISDLEYDALVKTAKKILKKFPSLKDDAVNLMTVGSQPEKGTPQIHHSIPMLSLDNAFNEEDITKFIDKTVDLSGDTKDNGNKAGPSKVTYVVEPKIDGLSASLIYSYGKLIRAGTRGNGIIGEDVTENARQVSDIPIYIEALKEVKEFEVRGEIYMSSQDFAASNAKRAASNVTLLSNPRNAAAGFLKRQSNDIDDDRKLHFFAYYIIENTLHPIEETHSSTSNETSSTSSPPPITSSLQSQQQVLELLQSYGFQTPTPYYYLESSNVVYKTCKEMERCRLELPYTIDGAVIKVNNIQHQQLLGNSNRAPKWAIAYKFTAEETETTLLAITIQVGRTGALTPVAILNPVSLGGVWIERASLHNEDEIRRMQLIPGCRVRVRRSGDVIPQVMERLLDTSLPSPTSSSSTGSTDIGKESEGNIDTTATESLFTMPTHCPECGSPTDREGDGAIVRCQSFAFLCPAQAIEKLRYFCSSEAADIMGVGPAKLKSLYQSGLVRYPADLYTLQKRNSLANQMISTTLTPTPTTTTPSLNPNDSTSSSIVLDTNSSKVEESVVLKMKKKKGTKDNVTTLPLLVDEEEVQDEKTNVIALPLNTAPGWGDKSAHNLFQNVEGKRSLKFDRFLIALGIRHIGKQSALLIAEHFNTLEALQSDINKGAVELSCIPGIGPKAISELIDLFGSTPTTTPTPLLGEIPTENATDNSTASSLIITSKTILQDLLQEMTILPYHTNNSKSKVILKDKSKKVSKKKKNSTIDSNDSSDDKIVEEAATTTGPSTSTTSTPSDEVIVKSDEPLHPIESLKDSNDSVTVDSKTLLSPDDIISRNNNNDDNNGTNSKDNNSTTVTPTPTPPTSAAHPIPKQTFKQVEELSQMKPLTNKTILITGKLYGITEGEQIHITREVATAICERLGATVVDTFTKDVTLVIVGEKAGLTKLKKIAQRGVEVYQLEKWIEIYKFYDKLKKVGLID